MKKIQILGTGCSKCEELATNAEKAAKELEVEYELVKIKNLNEIASFGIMIALREDLNSKHDVCCSSAHNS